MTKYINGKPVKEIPILKIPILKDVPLPPPSHLERNSALQEAARSMEVGDCIEVPYQRTAVTSNMSRTTGFKFTQRKVGDKLRIWRVA